MREPGVNSVTVPADVVAVVVVAVVVAGAVVVVVAVVVGVVGVVTTVCWASTASGANVRVAKSARAFGVNLVAVVFMIWS